MKRENDQKLSHVTFQIGGMDCASCADEIKIALLKISGVTNVIVNADDSKVDIDFAENENSQSEFARKLSELGFQIQKTGSRIRTLLKVSEMDCAVEEKIIRDEFKKFNDVESLQFDLLNKKLIVTHSSNDGTLINRLKTLGFRSEIYPNLLHHKNKSSSKRKFQIGFIIASGILALTGMMLELFETPLSVVLPIFILSIAAGGWRVVHKAFYSIKNLKIDINVLMTLAVVGASIIGEWTEAAAVMFLFALSLQIESMSIDKAKSSIQNLMKIIPDKALIKKGNDFLEILINDIVPGDMIFVKAGERIPIDGIVLEGTSTVDQSSITGESKHELKIKEESVYAGTINLKSPLLIQTTGSFKESQFAKIITLLEEASTKSKSQLQRVVDKFSSYYTPLIVTSAVLISIVPTLFFGGEFDYWFYKSLVLLVIGCPCALVISTPVSIVSGISRASKLGAIIKSPSYLESLGKTDAVVFDKTGTLTEGLLKVEKIIPLNNLSEKEIISIAYAIEINSEHAIADAIVNYAEEKEISLEQIENFKIIESGVSARFRGRNFTLGQPKIFNRLFSDEIASSISKLEGDGLTVIVLVENNSPVALICFSDLLRDNMKRTIDEIKSLGVNDLYILSGDNQSIISRTAKDIGITNFYFEQSPAQKLDVVTELNTKHKMLTMIGDGVNDAPALAVSKIGIAMGKIGTDMAIESSDITLVGDDISKLPKLIQLSRKVVMVIKENIFVSLAIKAVFILLTFLGIATMWSAVFADMGTSLLVVFNSLKILKIKL
ncbi:MAG: cation-translocating P-type ATPase [Bacteroidetes bacterium]|nr:cation-translocating P-type ATPase [Bacteroidota bacterium]